MQPNTSLSITQLTSDTLATTKGSPQALIELIQSAIISKLGGLPTFKGKAEERVFYANVDYQAAVILSGLSERSGQAHRRIMWDVYRSNEWAHVRVPSMDPITREPRFNEDGTPDTISFATYDEWFDAVSEVAHLDATISSVVHSEVTTLLPAIDTGKIDAEWEEFQGDLRRTIVRTVTVDDALKIERSKLETIMGPAKKKLKLYSDTNDDTILRDVGQMIEKALTLSRKELRKWLAAEGHSGDQVLVIPAYIAELGDSRAAMLLIVNEAQRKYIDALIGTRLDEFPATIDQIQTTLSDLVNRKIEMVDEDTDDDEDDNDLLAGLSDF